jgi:hypothetical protein
MVCVCSCVRDEERIFTRTHTGIHPSLAGLILPSPISEWLFLDVACTLRPGEAKKKQEGEGERSGEEREKKHGSDGCGCIGGEEAKGKVADSGESDDRNAAAATDDSSAGERGEGNRQLMEKERM